MLKKKDELKGVDQGLLNYIKVQISHGRTREEVIKQLSLTGHSVESLNKLCDIADGSTSTLARMAPSLHKGGAGGFFGFLVFILILAGLGAGYYYAPAEIKAQIAAYIPPEVQANLVMVQEKIMTTIQANVPGQK